MNALRELGFGDSQIRVLVSDAIACALRNRHGAGNLEISLCAGHHGRLVEVTHAELVDGEVQGVRTPTTRTADESCGATAE